MRKYAETEINRLTNQRWCHVIEQTLRQECVLIVINVSSFAEIVWALKYRKWTTHVTTRRIGRTGRYETHISHAEGLARCPESRSWHWASPGSRADDAPSVTHSLNIHMPDSNSFENHTSALTSDSCFPAWGTHAFIIVGYLTCISRKALHASLSTFLLVFYKSVQQYIIIITQSRRLNCL